MTGVLARPRPPDYAATMLALLAANVWHWWIGVTLTIVSVLAVVALVGGYVKKVTATKYPPRDQIDELIIE